jgi:fructose-bisphosphate aldolase class II
MLHNLAALLEPTRGNGYAVACFNVFGYEDALAVVDAAERRNASVILAINLDMTRFMPVEHIAAMLRPLAEDSSASVCLHLDHCYEIETVKRAVDCGFTSVMYDCSQQPIEDNISGIREVVDYAKPHEVSVEAEVGSVPYASGRDHIKSQLTEVQDARAMQDQGRPTALAISVGNVHRIETGFVDIDFEHFHKLRDNLELPLVIHGTSGIRPEDIQTLARNGVSKFNIGTNLRQRFGKTAREKLVQDPDLFDRLTLMKQIIPEVSDEAEKMIRLLGQ